MVSRAKQWIRIPAVWITVVVVAVAGAVAVTCVSGCGHSSAQGDSLLSEPQAPTVVVTTPKVETLRRNIVQPGWISSYESTPIYAKLAGYVEDLKVDIDYKLKKDDLMCKIYVPEVKEDVEVKRERVVQAQAELDQAKAMLEVAKANVVTWQKNVVVANEAFARASKDFDRWVKEVEVDLRSFKAGVLDKQQLAEAENQLEAAKATKGEAEFKWKATQASLLESEENRKAADSNVLVKEAKLLVSKKDLAEETAWYGYHEIRAPYDGVITHRYVHTGHFVQPSNSGTTSKGAEPMFMYMRTDKMRIVIQVPEYDAPLVKDGADAIVKIQALKDKEIVGKVTRSSWQLNNEARTLRVEVFLDNPYGELRPGMYVNVTILADLKNVMTLPVDAVQIEGDRTFVWVVEDGKARKLDIQTGVQNNRLIQLVAKNSKPSAKGEEPEWVPFAGNEKVIISNPSGLTDGQPVTAK